MKLNVVTEKKMESFYDKELLSRILWMSSYPVPGIHFRDKPKVILEFSNDVTKENQLILEALIH